MSWCDFREAVDLLQTQTEYTTIKTYGVVQNIDSVLDKFHSKDKDKDKKGKDKDKTEDKAGDEEEDKADEEED